MREFFLNFSWKILSRVRVRGNVVDMPYSLPQRRPPSAIPEIGDWARTRRPPRCTRKRLPRQTAGVLVAGPWDLVFSFWLSGRARRHLINSSRWRGQRFGPATRREEGASPQWGCDRRTTTWLAQRSAAPVVFSPIGSFIFLRLSLIQTPLPVFVRWLLGLGKVVRDAITRPPF